MKNGNWIGLDKNIVKLLPHGRAYTIIEALISFTIDIDNKREWTINGYAKQWGWSRNKVRKFANELGTGKGHLADRKGTGSGHLITLKLNNLHEVEDRKRTGRGQVEDRKRDTTINPNPKPNPKKTKTFLLDSIEYQLAELLFTEILKSNEDHKKPNLQTWSLQIDLMIRVDNRIPDKIKEVILWCQRDSFWQSNILSTKKLRAQYDQLLINMKSKPRAGPQSREERNRIAKEDFLNSFTNERDITPTTEAIE